MGMGVMGWGRGGMLVSMVGKMEKDRVMMEK
jgi:hypothetical protein